jgi:glyoxylase-like metal-dependent hydrolase (beta-lactamase superfamily II)
MITVKHFFHHETKTLSYIIYDNHSKDAVVIDPVLDFDQKTSTVSSVSLDQLCAHIESSRLNVHLIIDSHVHADHLSGAHALKKRLLVKSAIGEGFFNSQKYFSRFYDLNPAEYEPAYDHYLSHHQSVNCGSLTIKVLLTPGHTPTCTSLLIEDAVFVGDTLFQPYLGCGRTDFPSGSASTLYESITKQLYTLPDHYRVFTGHDYPQNSDEPQYQTTIGHSKRSNIMLNATTSKDDFVRERQARDQTLSPPNLLVYAMQVNILGGQLPKTPSGKHGLFMPLTVL